MKAEQFIDYFDHPGKLNSSSVVAFGEIIRQYPFCQPAQLLFLKSLRNDENMRFSRQLKICAVYAADRRVLFELLNIPKYTDGQAEASLMTEESKDPIELPLATTPINPVKEIEEPDLVRQVEHSLPILDNDIIDFDFPVYSEEPLPEFPSQNKTRNSPANELIDRFIKNPQPKVLRPDRTQVNEQDVSPAGFHVDDEFLTETLARIYIQQGYFLKAIQAFEKLSLKIPEKSIYFASQIEMVRELIKNQ